MPHLVDSSYFWLSLTDAGTPDQWRVQHGRMAGVPYWTGRGSGSCLLSGYKYPSYDFDGNFNCLWGAGEPNDADSPLGSNSEECVVTHAAYNHRMADLSCASTQISCYLCERTLCRKGTDCYAPNTREMRGENYPNCVCDCKDGAWGDRCQFPLAVRQSNGGAATAHMSHYATVCPPNPIGSAEEAATECRALGYGGGWAPATPNGRVAGSVRAAPLGLERAGGGARRRRMGGWLGRGPSMALDRWPPRRHSFPIRRGL